MPYYFRKSVSAGPFRFNFSKGGVGVSVGVKGFRVGTGPRGHYVHAGRGGFYYRATIGTAGDRSRMSPPNSRLPDREPVYFEQAGVEMIEVESGDVLAMRDETFGSFLDEANAKRQQISLAWLLGMSFIIIGLSAVWAGGAPGAILLVLAFPAWLGGRWLDSYRRSAVLFYDLEPEIEHDYQHLVSGFDALAECGGKWHVEAGGAVRDLTTWKRNAGASHVVRRNPTSLLYALPNVLKCNITPPALHVGRQVVYFLPDMALVDDGSKFGAVSYSELHLERQQSNFIEDGTVPRDARVIGHTWKHPNKSGGPDRRFNNNYQIPICLYEVIHFKSPTGLNELVELSKAGVAEPFANAVRALAHHGQATARPAGLIASM